MFIDGNKALRRTAVQINEKCY